MHIISNINQHAYYLKYNNKCLFSPSFYLHRRLKASKSIIYRYPYLSYKIITTASTASETFIDGTATPLPLQPGDLEYQAEKSLHRSGASIYGIPRSEWLKLNKPARYLGNELNACHKPWDTAQIRFSLTYPEIYEVGASNLGHIILYTLLNQVEGLLCDRCYYPADDAKEMLSKYDKKLFGVESRKPLNKFDVLGFSLSYELGGTNILDMLHLSGVPLTWQERKEPAGKPFDPENGSPPLIFAGGPTATSNPEPFSAFFDFFALGDGEEVLVEIGECLKKCKIQKLDRESTLFQLASTVQGVYVPQFYDAPSGFGGTVFPNRDGIPVRVKRRVCTPDPFQQIGLVPFVETVHDRLTVEIRRGCTRGCRFCQPGMLTRPARDVEPERVVDAVEKGMRMTGYNEFSLLSLSCSDYLSLPSVGIDIKNRLKDEHVSLSLPSQRVDAFDENIAHIITNTGKRSGLTFAPEAGTQRMRDVINKGLTNEELLRGVKTAWDKGWKQVKLYFMIGLPGETDADVIGIAETIAWLQKECRQGRWHLAVNVTISNFSPKPHTPFQWHTVSSSEFLRKQTILRKAFSKLNQVKANFTPVRISAMEDFIARGDRRISAVIRRAWELGALNDAWWQSEDTAFKAWSQAIEDVGMEWKYRQIDNGEWNVMEKIGDVNYRGQGGGGKGRVDRGELADARLDGPLPWDHIDTGITKFWLKTDLQRALEATTVPDCSHTSLCSECGVCGDDFGDNIVFEPPPIPEFTGHPKANSARAQRLRLRFSKSGDMVFVGHLDLMNLLDRACRRAALPITADESPFASRRRIYTALPLPLGATSTSEMLELYLTERRDMHSVRDALQRHLPSGIDLLSVEEALVYKIDGSNGEKMSQLLESVEYYVGLEGEAGDMSDISAAIEKVVGAEALMIERGATKKKPGKMVDVRNALLELDVCDSQSPGSIAASLPVAPGSIVLKFRTGCENGNPVLNPAAVVGILFGVSKDEGEKFIAHIHRSDIELRAPVVPKPDFLKLRSILRMEGHLSVGKLYSRGAWAGSGIENRADVR